MTGVSDGMTTGVFDFVSCVARASTIDELQSRYLDGVGALVESSAAGLYVLNPFTRGAESIAARGVSDYFLSRYEDFGRRNDPVLSEILEQRRAVDNRQLMTLDSWTTLPIYGDVFHLHRMANLLEAPLIIDDEVHGTVNFGRTASEGAFTSEDRAVADGIAKLLSVALTAMRSRASLERERDQVLAALELCSEAVIVTDLRNAERKMNGAARWMIERLDEVDARLDDLFARPVREGELVRHQAAVTLANGEPASICARSTRADDGSGMIVTFLDLICASPEPTTSPAIAGLTAREQQVAGLVARGLHDAEIADQLYLSRYTVKQYLKSAYSKVGVRSRVELTRLVLGGARPPDDTQ